MYKNGFIVKKSSINKKYCGINGDVWFLYYEGLFNNNINLLNKYFEQNIILSWENEKYFDCTNDFTFLNDYINTCINLNYDIEILFCESEKQYPKCEINISNSNYLFVGYDYAYAGGNFYSAVYNDVVSNRISEFNRIQLNEFGLFKNENDIKEFIKARNQLKANYPPYTFEEGDFVIVKLWKYIGNIPINNR